MVSGAANHLIVTNLENILNCKKDYNYKIIGANQGELIQTVIEGKLKVHTETGRKIMNKKVWIFEN